MRNSVLNYALLFETFVAISVSYIPGLTSVWGTFPIK